MNGRRIGIAGLGLLLALITLAAMPRHALAVSPTCSICTFDGTSGESWADPVWQQNGAGLGDLIPASGASLSFPNSDTTSANLGADFDISSITFSTDSTVLWDGTSSLDLGTAGITQEAGDLVFDAPLNLGSGTTVFDDAGDGMSFTSTSTIGGPGTAEIEGGGQTEFDGDNTYTLGTNVLAAATFELGGDNAAGSGTITVASTGTTTLMLSTMTVPNNWVLSGAGNATGGFDALGGDGADTLSGTVSLTGATTISENSGDSMGFEQAISGAEPLTFSGGLYLLSQAGSQSSTTVEGDARVEAFSDGVFGPSTSPVTVGNGSEVALDPGLSFSNALSLEGTGVSGLSEAALYAAGAGDEWTGSIAMTGDTTMGAFTSSSLTVGGVISGPYGLTLNGANGSVITLTGDNTYSGATDITSGTVDIDGTQTQSPVSVSQAILGGTGSVGAVTVNLGEITGGDAPGVLTVAGLSMNSGSIFMVTMDSATAGTGYSQIRSTGTIDLGSASLGFQGSYTPVAGNTFTLLLNKSGAPITGTFQGLAEGSTTTVQGRALTVTYLGNGEDDVVLTDPAPATTVPIPDTGAGLWLLLPLGGLFVLLGGSLLAFAWRRRPISY